MPRRPRAKQCPLCGTVSSGRVPRCPRCGTELIKRRFKMSPKHIKLVHALARQKGLSDVHYRDNLHAVGVETCKDMKQKHFDEFLQRMAKLPDAPSKKVAA